MCEYCDEEKARALIDDNGEIKIYIDKEMGNNLCIEYYHYGAKTNRYIPIAFCPMCSRLVNNDVLNAIQKSINMQKAGVQLVQQAAQPIIPNMSDMAKEINEAITKQLAVDPLKLFDTGNISGRMIGGI